ncbi:MAG: hypothetical protein ABJC04_13420, partial [Verrucomicrobiota bacterium]
VGKCFMPRKLQRCFSLLAAGVLALFLAGCMTAKTNWETRVGHYTFDQAVLELGPPDRSAKLSDGRTVSEWLVYRGHGGSFRPYDPFLGGTGHYNDYSIPDRFLRLTFSAEGKLEDWKKFSR